MPWPGEPPLPAPPVPPQPTTASWRRCSETKTPPLFLSPCPTRPDIIGEDDGVKAEDIAVTDVGGGQRLSLPAWSSDGSLIAASLDTAPSEPGGGVLAVVDPVTGSITRLGPAGEETRLRPTP